MLALRSTSRLPNFSALVRDFRGAGANRRLSRLPNLLADLAGFGRGGDSSAFPNCGDLSTFDLTSGLCSLSLTCRPARLAGAWGLARLARSWVTRKPFRAWADSSPLLRERLFGSSKLWRLERLDFHMQTSAYSARTWTASEATFAGRLGLLIAKLGAHPRTPKLLSCNVLRFQSANFLNNEVRISM